MNTPWPLDDPLFTRNSTGWLDGVESAVNEPRFTYGINKLTADESNMVEATFQAQGNASYHPGQGRQGSNVVRLSGEETTAFAYFQYALSAEAVARFSPGDEIAVTVWARRSDGQPVTSGGPGANNFRFNLYGTMTATQIEGPDAEGWTRWGGVISKSVDGMTNFGGSNAIGFLFYPRDPNPFMELCQPQVSLVSQEDMAWQRGGPSSLLIEEPTTNIMTTHRWWNRYAPQADVRVIHSPESFSFVNPEGGHPAPPPDGITDLLLWYPQILTEAASAGKTYTISADVTVNHINMQNPRLTFGFRRPNLPHPYNFDTHTGIVTGRMRLVKTITCPPLGENPDGLQGQISLPIVYTGDEYDIRFDNIQIEEKAYATSWHPIGTRQREFATLDPSLVDPLQGTYEFDVVLLPGLFSNNWNTLIGYGNTNGINNSVIQVMRQSTTDRLTFNISTPNGSPHHTWGNSGEESTVEPGKLYRVAAVWDWEEGYFAFYINGVQSWSKALVHETPPSGNAMNLGVPHTANARQTSAFFQSLKISRVPRTAAELADPTQPLEFDGDTSLLMNFTDDLSYEHYRYIQNSAGANVEANGTGEVTRLVSTTVEAGAGTSLAKRIDADRSGSVRFKNAQGRVVRTGKGLWKPVERFTVYDDAGGL